MTTRLLALILTAVAALAWGRATAAPASVPASAPASRPSAGRAVILAGSGGEKFYSRNLQDWAVRFHALLTGQAGMAKENVIVLTETADAKANPPRLESTVENFRQTMKAMRTQLRPGEPFVLVLLGHGQVQEPVGKLCLPGLDLKVPELADMLEALPTDRLVIFNCASGGTEFIKAYAAPSRVILSAAGAGDDSVSTYFAEFLLQGYETGRADTNKDKNIDLLEAYLYAARETANFYHRQYLTSSHGGKPAIWNVLGKNTRATWKKLYAGWEYQLASAGAEADNQPDPEVKWGEWNPDWYNRRVLTEHARLDDGVSDNFMLWEPYEFRNPPADEPGKPGYRARRIVLGRPSFTVEAAFRPSSRVAVESKP